MQKFISLGARELQMREFAKYEVVQTEKLSPAHVRLALPATDFYLL